MYLIKPDVHVLLTQCFFNNFWLFTQFVIRFLSNIVHGSDIRLAAGRVHVRASVTTIPFPASNFQHLHAISTRLEVVLITSLPNLNSLFDNKILRVKICYFLK